MKNEDIDLADLEPDIYALEEEWKRQPLTYKKWADKLADARYEYDTRKHEVEVVEAELDHDVRINPSKYGCEKITEPVVEKAIHRSLEYKRTVEEMHRAKHRVAKLEATVTALDHKKKALEKAVDLFLADYFSTPRVTGDRKEIIDRREKGATREQMSRR